MFKKTPQGYWVVEEFIKQSGLVHGFSTRKFGNMNENKNLDNFLKIFKIRNKDLVMMEQVHSNRIKVVGEVDKGKVIPGIDGMITNKKGIVLGVRVADCLPILLYDPVGKIIGVAHAGWQGVLKRIAQKVVDLMIKKGSIPSNMLVGIGPHIGGCCYAVQSNRAERFLKEFGKLGNMVFRDKNGIHLDVAVPIVIQLIASGVLKENIFLPLTCTSCQNQEFFSYRKERTNGRMLGIIGLIN